MAFNPDIRISCDESVAAQYGKGAGHCGVVGAVIGGIVGGGRDAGTGAAIGAGVGIVAGAAAGPRRNCSTS